MLSPAQALSQLSRANRSGGCTKRCDSSKRSERSYAPYLESKAHPEVLQGLAFPEEGLRKGCVGRVVLQVWLHGTELILQVKGGTA